MKSKNDEQLKVLFADDNKDITELVSELFSEYFPEVELTTVQNGYQALQKIRASYYHVLITDFDMPVASGLEVVRALKSVKSSLRPSGVILMSSHLTDGEPDKELNFVQFVHKSDYKNFLIKYFKHKQFLSCVSDDGASLRDHPRYSLEGKKKRVDIEIGEVTSFGILRDLSLSGLSLYVDSISDGCILGAEFKVILELDLFDSQKVISFDVEMVGQAKDSSTYIALKFLSLDRSDFDNLKTYLRQSYS